MKKMEMDEKKYQRILNTIINKAPIETGVQTLVFMLLDEIESEKNRNRKKEEKVSVLVADLRKGETPIFGGEGGIVDLCVVNENFKYVKEPLNDNDIDGWNNATIRTKLKEFNCWEEQRKKEKEDKISRNGLVQYRKESIGRLNNQWKANFEEQKKNRIGCVEIKATNIQLPGIINQIAGHIQEFKRVIYTNGLVWIYFDIANKDNIKRNDIEESIRNNLKYILETRTNVEDEEYKLKKQNLEDKAGFKWNINLVDDKEQSTFYGANKSMTYTTNRDCVKVGKEQFDSLVMNLNSIDWKS